MVKTSYRFLIGLTLLLLLYPTSFAQVAIGVEEQKRRLETFEDVWQTINDNHFDKTFGGVNWEKVKEEFEPRVRKLESDSELHELLGEMVGRLKLSHFGIIPPEVYITIEEAKEEAKQRLKDLEGEGPAEKEKTEDSEEEDGLEAYSKFGVGIELRLINKEFVITRVEKGSAGEKNGLRPGYILKKINGIALGEFTAAIRENGGESKTFEKRLPIQIVDWFLRTTDANLIRLTISDENDIERDIDLVTEKIRGELIKVIKNFPEQFLQYESKSISDDIGYIKFNFFALAIIEKFCKSISDFKDKKAIIIDLRGNMGGLFGGMMGISGLLVQKKFELGTEIYRKRKSSTSVDPYRKNFDGKVVILVDGSSYSAAEIFAAAFQDNRRATIVGERTAGEALPSLSKTLPTGAVFVFPVANFKSPKGRFLEGRGVKPDISIKLTRASLLAGRDDQLNAALKLARPKSTLVEATKRKTIIRGQAPPPPRRLTRLGTVRSVKSNSLRVRHSPSALKIIDRYLQLAGGKEALSKVTSFRAIGGAELKRAGAVVEGLAEFYWKAPNKYSEGFSFEGVGQIREVFDGKRYFVQSEFTPANSATPPLAIEDKRLAFGFSEMLRIRDLYARILYKGVFDLNGRKVNLIEATTKNRLQNAFLFDVKTGMLVKRVSRVSGEMVFSDYRKVGDVLLPFHINRDDTITYRYSEMELNLEINDSFFEQKKNCFDEPIKRTNEQTDN